MARQPCDRSDERIAGRIIRGERLDRRTGSITVRLRSGEEIFPPREFSVLVWVADIGDVELVELKAEQVDLASSRTAIAAQRREGRIDLGEPRPSRPQRSEIDAGEPVERIALCCSSEQALVCVLAVEVDEPSADIS